MRLLVYIYAHDECFYLFFRVDGNVAMLSNFEVRITF